MTGDNQDVLDFLNQTKSMYDEDSANYRMCEKAIAAVTGIEKVAKKLAYIHQCIDLYCDREELHDESYWLDYILDPEWIDTDIGWTGDKMTPNQSETPTRCDHTAEVGKKVDRLISLQAAIDALDGNVIATSKESAQAVMDYIRGCADRIRSLPSAQPDLDSAYTEGYTAAESKYRKMWDEMQKIILCKYCKHADEYCHCSYTTWWNSPNDFCSKGERRTDEAD